MIDSSVQFQALKQFQSTPRSRFNRALITFVPTGGLVAGFTELSLAVTASNWKVLLRARGGVSTDLLWKAVEEYWAPAFASAGVGGQNPAKAKQTADKLILGRRTRAEPTLWTALITDDADGTYTLGAVGYTGVATFVAVAKTVLEIQAGLIASWNGQADLAAVSTAVSNGADSVDIETDTEGFPLIVYQTSTGGAITLTSETVDGDYEADLDDIRADNILAAAAAGTPAAEGEFWAIHDLQLDDVTNRQGVTWCIAERTADATKTYVYFGESYQSTISNAGVVNDQASTLKTLLTPYADQNNDRGAGLFLVARVEFAVCGWLGRWQGYNLGRVNPAQRELINVTPLQLGDDEVVATIKFFNFYSPESPKGNVKWGYLGSGRYIDDLWAEDILSHVGRTALLGLLVGEDVLPYTDQGGISQGKSAIIQALLPYQGPEYGYLLPDSIQVTAGAASAQSMTDKLEKRLFSDYTVAALTAPPINRYGSPTNVITLTISV